MKRSILFLFALLISLLVFSLNRNTQKLYVGTFTSEGAEGIYLCNFNSETGEITLNKTFKGVDNPSFLKVSPNGKYLYSVLRAPEAIGESGGYVVAYEIGRNGTLHFLNKQVSNGADPCHVDVSPDGKYVAIATYSGGTTSLYPVSINGEIGPSRTVLMNKGSGPDKARQSKPHAHSIKFSPFDNQVFSADLGTDQLNIYHLENSNLISKGQNYVKMEAGAGPRHFEFHPNGEVIYVINELNSTVTAIQKKNNRWDVFQNISTLPAGFDGTSYCADIHISKDGKYLYASNRGHNSITVFQIDADSKDLTFIETVSVEGDWPRNFTLSPDGRFMLVANQKSGNITVFKIHPKTGIPEFVGKEVKLPAPVCLEFL